MCIGTGGVSATDNALDIVDLDGRSIARMVARAQDDAAPFVLGELECAILTSFERALDSRRVADGKVRRRRVGIGRSASTRPIAAASDGARLLREAVKLEMGASTRTVSGTLNLRDVLPRDHCAVARFVAVTNNGGAVRRRPVDSDVAQTETGRVAVTRKGVARFAPGAARDGLAKTAIKVLRALNLRTGHDLTIRGTDRGRRVVDVAGTVLAVEAGQRGNSQKVPRKYKA